MAVSLIFGLALLATAICTAHTTENYATDVELHTELSSGSQVEVKFICPTLYGRYAHPTSCEYFLECRLGYSMLMKCHQGFLYDVQAKQCRDRRTVTCNKGNKVKEDQKQVIPFRCPTPSGRFAHPYDCSKYFECSNNNPELYHCYSNDLYDANIGKCIHRNKVNCGSRFNKYGGRNQDIGFFKCPSSSGLFPHPYDCSKYLECHNGVPSLFHCYPNDLFDLNVKYCIRRDKVSCGNRYNKYDDRNENTRLFKCPIPKGRFAHPYDCSKYIECNNNIPELFFCYPNDLFDANIGKCVLGNNVNCGDRFNKYALKATFPYSSSAQVIESNAAEVIKDTKVSSDIQVEVKFICPTLYGRYAHPTNCEYFLECRLGYSMLMKCNQGFLYDEQAKQCRDRRTVTCNKGIKDKEDQKQVIPFRCPTPSGRFAHPYDCSKYFECRNNNPDLYHCYSNELYDANIGKCIHRDKVNCGSRFNKYGDRNQDIGFFKCPSSSGLFPHPHDCSKYLECHNNVPSLFHCYPNDLFDVNVKHCIRRDKVNCGNRYNKYDDRSENIRLFKCPIAKGRFAHPYDCSKYIECNNNIPELFFCYPNDLFDANIGKCVRGNNVNCGDRFNKYALKAPVSYIPSALVDERNEAEVIQDTEISSNIQSDYTFTCPALYGRFPHPNYCDLFFECRLGYSTRMKCHQGFLYDERAKQCRDRRTVTCNRGNKDREGQKQVIPFRCLSPSGRFAHPYDCSKYIECSNNNPVLYQCYSNDLYETNIGKCIQHDRVNCGSRFNKYGGRNQDIGFFRCPSSSGLFAHPYDCSMYFECHNNVPSLFQCYPNDLFEVNLKHCISRDKVICGNRYDKYDDRVDNIKRFKCPYATGRFPHPYDCSKYIECRQNVPDMFQCYPNDLFDTNIGQCTREKVDCGNRINKYAIWYKYGTV